MGREIRLVPPGWEHPRRECKHEPWNGGCREARANGGKCLQPLYDRSAEDAWAEWQKEYAEWLAGEHDRIIEKYGAENYPKDEPYRAFCEWHGEPPDPAYYRPAWNEDNATAFQMYETVSEGTPVSPVFQTREELAEYLIAKGDYWDQRRGHGGWDREAAERFVGMGYAPSMMVQYTSTGVEIKTPRDGI